MTELLFIAQVNSKIFVNYHFLASVITVGYTFMKSVLKLKLIIIFDMSYCERNIRSVFFSLV